MGQEVFVAVRAAFAVPECVVERGEELEPPLDQCIVVPHFAYVFQCLVIGEYAQFRSPKVASDAFEIPNDAAGLQIKRSPIPLRVERSSADIRDRFHGTVRLLLFEGGDKPVNASVAVYVEQFYFWVPRKWSHVLVTR